MNWIGLKSAEQLELIKTASFEKPQIIFKHSTRCSVSADAYDEMDKADLTAWYLDLLANRALSNQIASDFGVMHQSPQIIIIKDGKAAFNESHWRIKAENVKATLETFI